MRKNCKVILSKLFIIIAFFVVGCIYADDKPKSDTESCDKKTSSDCKENSCKNNKPDETLQIFKTNLKNTVEKFVRLRVKNKDNFSCIVCINGEVIYKNNFAPDELICMGSITKQFTAYLLFQYLIKHNSSNWHDVIKLPIAQVPDLKEWCSSVMKDGECDWMSYVTIEDLLSHKSGMLKMETFKTKVLGLMLKNLCSPIKHNDMLKYFICDKNLKDTETFLYSDVNYIVLTLIVEKLYRKSYPDLIKDLADRDGLSSLKNMPDLTISKIIKTVPGMHQFKRTKYFPIKFCYGTGSLCANIIDINKWCLNKSEDVIYKILAKPRSYSKDVYYGYGLYMNYDASAFWHPGRYYRFCSARTFTIYYKQCGVAVTLSVDGDEYFKDLCDIVDNVYLGIRNNRS